MTSQDNDLSEDIDPGLLMDLVFIVENNGKGTAFDIDVSCRVNDVLYETNRIPIIPAETFGGGVLAASQHQPKRGHLE